MSEPNALREVRAALQRKPYTVAELVNELWYRPGTIYRAIAQLKPEPLVVPRKQRGYGNHPRAYALSGQGRHAARYGIPQEPKL